MALNIFGKDSLGNLLKDNSSALINFVEDWLAYNLNEPKKGRKFLLNTQILTGKYKNQPFDTPTEFGSLSGTAKWSGGVLAANGSIYGIPYNSTTVLKIDPTTDTSTTFGSLSGTAKWETGVLAANGSIYGIPRDSTTVLKIDPTTDTATTFGSLSGTSKWSGGVLAANGSIYGIPLNSTTVLKISDANPPTLDEDFVLSRYLNKF